MQLSLLLRNQLELFAGPSEQTDADYLKQTEQDDTFVLRYCDTTICMNVTKPYQFDDGEGEDAVAEEEPNASN